MVYPAPQALRRERHIGVDILCVDDVPALRLVGTRQDDRVRAVDRLCAPPEQILPSIEGAAARRRQRIEPAREAAVERPRQAGVERLQRDGREVVLVDEREAAPLEAVPSGVRSAAAAGPGRRVSSGSVLL